MFYFGAEKSVPLPRLCHELDWPGDALAGLRHGSGEAAGH